MPVGRVDKVLGSFVTFLALIEGFTSNTVGNGAWVTEGVSKVEEIPICLVAFGTCVKISAVYTLI